MRNNQCSQSNIQNIPIKYNLLVFLKSPPRKIHYTLRNTIIRTLFVSLIKTAKESCWVFQLRVYFYHIYNNTTNFTVLKLP